MSNKKNLATIREMLNDLGIVAHSLNQLTDKLESNLDNVWSIHELKEQALMIQGAIVRAKLASLEDPEES